MNNKDFLKYVKNDKKLFKESDEFIKFLIIDNMTKLERLIYYRSKLKSAHNRIKKEKVK